jgi:hypothetical protein
MQAFVTKSYEDERYDFLLLLFLFLFLFLATTFGP